METSWQRLKTLLENHHKDILKREASGRGDFIYLYDTGDYWVAFEQSAFMLRRIFPESDIVVLHLKTWLFPVVMVSVADSDFRKYSRIHTARPMGPDRRVLPGGTVSLEQYTRWHKAVEEGTV